MGLINSGLIRIKNGFVQKLSGCVSVFTTLHGAGANVILRWLPSTPLGFLFDPPTAVGSHDGLEANGHDITPAGFVPPPTSQGSWSLAIWGADQSLISSFIGGGNLGSTVYIWTPSLPYSGSGVAVAVGGSAPVAVNGIFVAAPQHQAFAWGVYSASLGAQDFLKVAWCDVDDLTDWTATAINQAGSFSLSSGSGIVSGTWFNLTGLFWTDIDLWTAQYIGFPLVYGFNKVGQNCGLLSPRAWGVLGNIVAWMGHNDFYVFSGGAVNVIPCEVRDFIFNTLDPQYILAVHCDVNSQFGEFTWRFPQIGSGGVCNAYVKWSANERDAWDVWADPVGGPMTAMWLTAWCDESVSLPPLGVDYTGKIQRFNVTENGYDGAGLDSFFRIGWFYLSEGQEQVFVERIMPDFIWSLATAFYSPQGTLQMTFYFADEVPATSTDYPIRTYGPYTVTPDTPYLIIRGSGRVMSYRVDCASGATFYREGKHMARVAITGRGR